MISCAMCSFPRNAASMRGVNPSASITLHLGAQRDRSSLAHASLPMAAHSPSSVLPRTDANA